MKLVVPYVDGLQLADARLIRLGEFLGAHCEPLQLPKRAGEFAEFLEQMVPDRDSCLVINPKVMREWAGNRTLQDELISSFLIRFAYLLVHALEPDPFIGDMVAALSGSKLQAVLRISGAERTYEIDSNSKDICGPFSGLSIGGVDVDNDRVFAVPADDPSVRKLICIGGQPFMATAIRDKTEILFIASEGVADVDERLDSTSLASFFSRFVPHAMALRYIFRGECWRPSGSFASIIIDDPLLRRDYGYLNFPSVLALAQRHNFHTTISFIPHNYRRNSDGIIRMFRENPHRLSICFHGNDHTKAEFASTDTAFLNRILTTAEDRMNEHERMTGLHCDKVMVFPQDNYTVQALEVLNSRNFRAAVSSPHPVGDQISLTIADLAQPAVVRFAGFPLFTRDFIRHARTQDIAFKLFFGKPVLIGEHHDAFKDPEPLLDVVRRINSIDPSIIWWGLENIAENSMLRRRRPDGTVHIRPYSNCVRIINESSSTQQYLIDWARIDNACPVEHVLRDGLPFRGVEADNTSIRVLAELPARSYQVFSVACRNNQPSAEKLGLIWDARVFLRRRLSEVRDNYLSKNQRMLTTAKALQQRLLK
jgi:hypothetical protein